MAAATTDPTHEINWYVSVKDRLDEMGGWSHGEHGIPVKTKSPLSKALTQLSTSPAISFTATHIKKGYRWHQRISDISLTVSGEDAGTFGNPNVEKILEKSKPSPFGRGEKTVMDLEYRNGREIEAKDIILESQDQKCFYELIKTHISETLFVERAVEIKLYKLALYGKEGHFDWHRDTTHGDDHHATVLVALNTPWEGGNLALKYEGKTVDVDMHTVMRGEPVGEAFEDDEETDEESDGSGDEAGEKPEKPPKEKRSILGFQIIAFYTDIEHKVENITDGTRIVLQFDVNVAGGKSLKPADKHAAKKADEDVDEDADADGDEDKEEDKGEDKEEDEDEDKVDDEDEEEDEYDEEDEDEDEDRDGYEELPNGSGFLVLDTLKPLFPISEANESRDTILKEIVATIKKRLTTDSINEVVFPLRHLYRLASIRPEYLKGLDTFLYEALKKTFEVSLKPIVVIHKTDLEGHWDAHETRAYPFVSVQEVPAQEAPAQEDAEEAKTPAKRKKTEVVSEPEEEIKVAKKRKIEWKSEVHVPARYELMRIGSVEYIEYTGNEAQVGEGRYFGGGMFVKEKAA